MSESLIAQVRALAEAQKCGALFEKLTRIETGVYVPTWFYFDFPALLMRLERMQAVVDAARELRKLGPLPGGSLRASIAAVEAAVVVLDAALENLENNDGK